MRRVSLLLAVAVLAGCATVESEQLGPSEDANSRATVHTQLALGYLQRDQKQTALDELEEALDISPDHSQANYVMAMLQTQLDHPEEADRYYRKALDSDPENAVAAHDYGIFLCKEGRIEKALEYFQRALDNPLYDAKMLTNLRAGECLINMRTDRRGAEPYFKAVLDANPRLGTALYYMADIAYAREEHLVARGYIERYFAVGPDTPRSLLLAVKIESELNADQVAQEYATRLKEKFASSDEARQLKIYQ